MKNFLLFSLSLLICFFANGQTIVPAVNNVGGGTFRNSLYELDFSIGETSIKTINSPTIQISEGVIQRNEANCTTPDLTISGSASVCPGVSSFYSLRRPNRTSIYTWSITGQGSIVSGQGSPRIFVSFGQNIQDQISVRETTKEGCIGQAFAVQVGESIGRYGIPSIDLNCSTTLFSVPVLALASVPSGITAMDLTLGYDHLSVTPTGVSFIGNVVRQNFPNNAVSLYTDYTQPGIISVSISYSALAPITANFASFGTIVAFNFNRLSSFTPGTTTSIRINELIEGNLSGINYQCGNAGVVSLKNNEITGTISHIQSGRRLSYNTSNPAQFNATTILGVDMYCQPTGYSVFPDQQGNFKFNIDNGEKISIQRDVVGSYYSGATAQNVQSVINSNDAFAISNALIKTFPWYSESWKDISRNAAKLAKVYSMDVDMDGLVTSLDLYYVQKRSVLQIKEFPQVWNYTDGVPNNTSDVSKDWLFVDRVKFNQLASTLNTISILPPLPECLDEPSPSTESCTPLGSQLYYGILLGDVDGNWNTPPLNSNAIRNSNESQLIVALDSALSLNNGFQIPVMVQHTDSVKALDFYFDYDADDFIVADLKPTFDPIQKNFIWNNFNNQTVLAGAYSKDTFVLDSPLYFLNVLSSIPLQKSSFKDFKAFINGNEVPVSFRKAITTSNSETSSSSYLNVYPNPVLHTLSIQSQHWGNDQIEGEIYNSSGQVILKIGNLQKSQNSSTEVDISSLSSGVYTLKLRSDKLTKVIKLIKQ